MSLLKLPTTLNNKLFNVLPDLPFIHQPIMDDDTLHAYFNNHVAAITGAGSGMGRTLALKLAALGCHLALSDINEDNLAATHEMLAGFNIKVTIKTLDVSDQKAVFAWADEVVADHGKVNFIFNNAGVALYSSVEGMSFDEIEWVMNINFWGVVYGTKAFLPLIKNSVALANKQNNPKGGASNNAVTIKQHGHVINISSLFGLTAQPSQSAYNASKFAVRGFTESLRYELDIQRCGVSTTCVHPGGIKTNIANSARGNDSIKNLGMKGGEASLKTFNKFLRFDANKAALIILSAVVTDSRRCLIGNDAKVLDALQRISPSHYSLLVKQTAKTAKLFNSKGKRSK